MELISTTEAYGHDADLYEEIRTVGWETTPFFSALTAKAPRARTNPSFGHQWKFMDIPDGDAGNAHIEGSASATADKFELGNATNHYQIVKSAFGVTGSEEAAEGLDGKKELARQADMSRIKHAKDIEIAICGAQAPVQRVNTTGAEVAGQLGGVKHFLTGSTDIDTAGATQSWALIRELLKVGFMNGIPFRYLMMGDTQKDALDDILFSKTVPVNMGNSKIDNNVTMIGNTAYGNNIKVILNPFLDDDEIIAFNDEYVNPVIWRPTKIHKVAKDVDGKKREFITELTLRVEHEYAIARLDGLAV